MKDFSFDKFIRKCFICQSLVIFVNRESMLGKKGNVNLVNTKSPLLGRIVLYYLFPYGT